MKNLIKWFLYLHFGIISVLAAVRLFSEGFIESLGILIIFTPVLFIFLLLLGGAAVAAFKANNAFVKTASQILFFICLFYVLLLGLYVSNVSHYFRQLTVFLLMNSAFVLYLGLASVVSIFAVTKFHFSVREKVIFGTFAFLTLVYSLILGSSHLNPDSIAGKERLLTPNGQQSIFYESSDGTIIISYQKNCSWCKTKPDEIKVDTFTVLGRNIGKTSDTVFFADIYGHDQNDEYLKLSHLDAETFEIFSEHPSVTQAHKSYSRDKNAVYYGLVNRVDGADPETFREFTNIPNYILERSRENDGYPNPWYRDKNNIFFRGHMVEMADPESFQVMTEYEAEDKNYTYSTRHELLRCRNDNCDCDNNVCVSLDLRTSKPD